MAHKQPSRVAETSTSTGTGALTVAGALSGMKTFGSELSNGDTVDVLIVMGSDGELSRATYATSGTTLTRTTVLASTNADAAVNWGAGTKTIKSVAIGLSDQDSTGLTNLRTLLGLPALVSGRIGHEGGGLEADVSGYDGLTRITGGATSAVPYVAETAWTPVIYGTSTAGAGTYTEQTGYYYRVGGMVFISGIVTWTAHTGTGNMDIDGLPIAVARTGLIPLWWSNITFAAGQGITGVVISAIPNRILIRNLPATTAAGAAVAIDTAGSIYFGGFYFA